jgi:hypothetical protein
MKGHRRGSFRKIHPKIWKAGAVCFLAAAVPILAMAQWPADSQQPPVQQWPGAQANPEPIEQPQQAQQPALSPEQLDDLVAPIALYPDPLLGQLLVASTYPLELVEAQQWLTQNRGLSGQQLMDAARQQSWDPSVQAMVAFPEVLARLTQDVSWTTSLGNAFLSQQADVMAAVQTMRARAQANGRLNSSPQQVVTTQSQGDQSAIAIQPADPQVIYVPQYDPTYVWGPPTWGAYPPLYYPSYGYGYWPGVDIGLCFGGWGRWGGWGSGYGGFGGAGALAASLLGGWGWNPVWALGSVLLNNGFFSHFGFHSGSGYGGYGGGYGGYGAGGGRTYWGHDPMHRLGVPYPNRQLSGRFGAASLASRANLRSFGGRNSFGSAYGGNRGAYGGNRGAYGGGANTYAGRSGNQGRAGYGNANRGYAGGAGTYAGRGGSQGSVAYGNPGNRGYTGGAYGANRGAYGGGAGAYAGRGSSQGSAAYGNPGNRGYTGGAYGGFRNGASNGYSSGYRLPGGAQPSGGARYAQPGPGSYNRSYGSAPVMRSNGVRGFGGSTPGYGAAPMGRSFAGSAPRSGSAPQSFNGRSPAYSGGTQIFRGGNSGFGGGRAPSFNAKPPKSSSKPSFGGGGHGLFGGGGHSFGGGGGHSGGGRSFSGGGHSGGGHSSGHSGGGGHHGKH